MKSMRNQLSKQNFILYLKKTKNRLFVTLHRILMLKMKARAQHAFTLKQKNLF